MTTISRSPVKSSNIKSVGHDGASLLDVEFSSGTVYRYSDVPAKLYSEMISAPSVGSFFAANVRGKFESKKLDGGA
jgi:hypothetical protein